MVINHPLSASSIFYDPCNPPCSIYVPESLSTISLKVFFGLPLSLAPPPDTPYISSSNHCLLFAVHAHTIAICFAVVPKWCHLILVFLSTFTWNSVLQFNTTHPSDHSYLCPLKCHLIFLSCNILLRTQLLYNLPLTVNDISLLVSNGTNCLNLFYPVRILLSTAASASLSTLNMSPKYQNLSTNSRFVIDTSIYTCASFTSYWIHATSTNKCFLHFIHGILYTTTFPVYPLLTTCTLYWIITNTSTTNTTWPSSSLLRYLLPFPTKYHKLHIFSVLSLWFWWQFLFVWLPFDCTTCITWFL